MSDCPRCWHPDEMAVMAAQSRRNPHVTWALVGDLPGVVHDALRQAIAEACALWVAVSNVAFAEAADPARADLLIATGHIDGLFNILAQTELPGPPVQHMLLDVAEGWTLDVGPNVPRQRIEAVPVIAHEIGHALGLGHCTTPGVVALMNPVYSPGVTRPLNWDAQEAQGRYGPPQAPTPVPRPQPPTPPAGAPAAVALYDASGRELGFYTLTTVGR